MNRTALLIILAITATSVFGGSGKSSTNGDMYVLLVTGINKDAKDRLTKDKALVDLRTFFLTNASVQNNHLSVLANSRSLVENNSQIATAENLKARIEAFANISKATDRFVFYYVGQANVADNKLRLNLPGADMTHEQLAELLGRIKASSMLIVLDCPGAGLAVSALAGPGRVVVAGCTAEQPYSTRFSEYFVPALADRQCDINSDGRVSLLEAFTAAAKNLDDFYRRMGLLRTETPLLEDDADGQASDQPWKHEHSGGDGLAASKFYLSSREQGAITQ